MTDGAIRQGTARDETRPRRTASTAPGELSFTDRDTSSGGKPAVQQGSPQYAKLRVASGAETGRRAVALRSRSSDVWKGCYLGKARVAATYSDVANKTSTPQGQQQFYYILAL
jgi:hypothetical protein